MGDKANIVSGPASVTLGANELGYTQGGVAFSVQPSFRSRTVDAFGDSEIDLIHMGDEVRLTVPLCEWTAATLQTAYATGNDETAAGGSGAYMGIGGQPGTIYPSQAATIIPMLDVDAGKKITLNRVAPIGQFELNFTHSEDRVFSTQLACLADQEAAQGEWIGKIYTPPAAPSGTGTGTGGV